MTTLPVPPGLRIAYDRDGTAVLFHNGSTVNNVLSTAEKQALNDESAATTVTIPSLSPCFLAFVFSAQVDLFGWGFEFGDAGTTVVETSTDTTTGVDGTWTGVGTWPNVGLWTPDGTLHRTGIQSPASPALTVRGVRFHISGITTLLAYGLHLYGQVSPGQTLDRLELQTAGGVPVSATDMDWGDVPQGSSADKQFLICNKSTTKTASNILLSFSSLTPVVPAAPAQYLISTDGGLTFLSTGTIVSILPGGNSAFTVRKATPSNADIAPHDVYLVALPGTFA